MLGRLLAFFCAVNLTVSAQEDGIAFFEKNVRPLLARQCLSCHSQASQPVMGGLRLDDRALAIKGGSRGASIVPGKPAESLLLKAVRHEAGPLKMPPGPKMKDADQAILAQWIQMGAPWGAAVSSQAATTKFWAFLPPVKPAIPNNNARTPIDAFLNRDLAAKALPANAAATKREWIRRATFDLTGLPPSKEDVANFLADNSAEAHAKVIDRLLASPRYGERWARHWMDVARYADSNGLDENLVYKNAFRYRDYLIAAFNKDKPFDLFIKEQLAGDLLPETSDLQTQFERWTATGFLSLGAKMLAEDDPVKMEMDIVDEQLDTTMRAFTALTVGCARCHDHKFDPIPHADYYAMAGIFKSSKTMEHFKVVAKWHEYVLAPKHDRDRLAEHEGKIEAKTKEIGKITRAENLKITGTAKQRVGDYLIAAAKVLRNNEIKIAPVEKEEGAIVLPAGKSFEFTVNIEKAGEYQLDVLNEKKGAGTADVHINGEWVKRGLPPVSNRQASPDVDGWTALGVFSLKQGENKIRFEQANKKTAFDKLLIARNTLATAPKSDVQIANEAGLNPSILDQLVEDMERSRGAASSVLYGWEAVALGSDRAAWISPAAKLFEGITGENAVAERYTAAAKQAIAEGTDTKDPGLKAIYEMLTEKFGPFRAPGDSKRYYPETVRAALSVLEKEQKELEAATPEFPRAMGVTESGTPADLAIHLRGSHWNLGEKVPRGFLRNIGGTQPIGSTTSGRLQLAEWLASKDHPLTARVIVNRVWRWHFGRGIVPSVDNFGRLGEKPTNQDLLDYLAIRFVESGWSLKQLSRDIMLTDAYRRSSTLNAKAAEADPENALLWRYPRRRLEAEAMRDAIMQVSGGLDLSTTSGSLLKYKDRQYVANTAKRGDVDYERNIRAVYIPVVRSGLYDLFAAFDLPDPTTSNGDRDSSVVAPQALFMMNGAVMLRHSMTMAKNLLDDKNLDDPGRIREAYERALSRPATSSEIDQALTFIARMRDAWKGDNAKAWQSFCKALLSSNEFLYVN